MTTFATKTVLWAGPEDGLEVEVSPGQTEYLIPGLPNMNINTVIANPSAEESLTKGYYIYNSDTKRFEWKGYR